MLHQVIDLLLPPASLGVLALFLVAFGGRRARVLAGVSLALLVALAIPLVARELLLTLAPPAGADGGPPPGAIVLLSAEGVRVPGAIDLAPGVLTLEREQAAAALARRTGLPIVASGGSVSGARTTLAAMMGASLRDDFGVPARWEEDRSTDTWQNAAYSADILRPLGITRVYVVTHFWHMRRALIAFRRAGLDPVAAPVHPPSRGPVGWADLLPEPRAWFGSYLAAHEWVGLIYYSLRA